MVGSFQDQGLFWGGRGAGTARKSGVQPGQVELKREHYVMGHLETGQELQGEVGDQSGQGSCGSPPAGPWAWDTVFACLNLPERGVPPTQRTAACSSSVAEGRGGSDPRLASPSLCHRCRWEGPILIVLDRLLLIWFLFIPGASFQ